MKMRWIVATVAIAAIPTSVVSGGRCTIVYDGTQSAYEHELAHCNGWVHQTFVPNLSPPDEYVHDFAGRLRVVECGWQRKCRSTGRRCYAMWKERGISTAYSNAPAAGNIAGCSFFD